MESVHEVVGLHDGMYSGIGCQSVISIDLSFNGSLKGIGHFCPEIIVLDDISMLLKDSCNL